MPATIILQSEAAECALASLAMVATAHGQSLDLSELRRRFPTSLKGANLRQLIGHATVQGVRSFKLLGDHDPSPCASICDI